MRETAPIEQGGRAAVLGSDRLDYGVPDGLDKPGEEAVCDSVDAGGGSGKPRVAAAAEMRALVYGDPPPA